MQDKVASNKVGPRAWLGKLARNSGWMVLAQVAKALEALVRSVIIARILSMEDYAAYAVALAFVSLITELANLNFGAVIVTYGARYRINGQHEKLSALFRTGYLITIITVVAACFASIVLFSIFYHQLIDREGLYWSVVMLSIATALSHFDVINKPVLRLLDRFRASCIGDLIVTAVNLTFLFTYLRVVEPTPTNALIAVSICTVFSVSVSSSIALVVSWGAVGNWLRARLYLLKEDLRSMFRMMLGNSVSSSMQRAIQRGDVLLLGIVGLPSMVATYDIAKKLVNLMQLPRVALALAVWPQVSADIASGRHDMLRRLLAKFSGYGIVTGVLAVCVVWMMAEPVVDLIYGKKYMSAAPVLTILVIGSIVQILFFWGNALLLSGHMVRMQVFSTAVGFALVLGLGWLLANEFGAVGMAWAVVLATAGQYVIVAIAARRILREGTVVKEGRRSVLSTSARPQVQERGG